jgi:hypothetical protein
MHRAWRIIFIVTACALTGRAAEATASGISLPFFDDHGKPTHKMTAARGTLEGVSRRLEEVEIHYFSATDPTVIVQKVQAREATWDEKKETLTGTGSILVATEENRLTGEGFDFALATSLLHVHRNFKMENREIVLTSERATAELIVAKSEDSVRFRDVKTCEAMGNLQVVVQPTATRPYDFKTASSDVAIYDGAEKNVTMPNPVNAVLKSGQPATFNKIQFKVGPMEKKAGADSQAAKP